MLITLEGIEGSGKSTQAVQLAARLRAAGRAAHQTREPGGTPLADVLRVLLLRPDEVTQVLAAASLTPPRGEAEPTAEAVLPVTELFVLSAARAQHVARMRGWLAAGEIVICDRFADATRAYQGYGRGLDLAQIAAVERLATGGLRPSLTLLFDLPVEEGQRRKQAARADGGAWDRLDREAASFHERVRAGYLALATSEPDRWVVLDAAQPADEVTRAVWAAVAPRISHA
jgi:dTMP kinase